MYWTHKICLILAFIGCTLGVNAQGTPKDSASIKKADPPSLMIQPKQKSPKIAGWLSTAVPGAGQAYNGGWSIVKIPVIYGGFYGLYYLWGTNYKAQNFFLGATQIKMDTSLTDSVRIIKIDNLPNRGSVATSTPSSALVSASLTSVQNEYFYYRTQVQRIYMFTAVWYILNIVDAVVDAHMKNYDISDDLSLKVDPYVLPSFNSVSPGIRLSLHF